MKGLAGAGPRISDRRGMTLVELLVAMVVAGTLMVAIYQVMITSQRVFTVQREQVAGHQTVRAGLDLLFSELREVSAPEGDLLSIGSQEVEFRAMRSFGLVCAINPSQSRLSIWVRGDDFEVGQGISVFIDDDPEISSDDEWAEASIQNVSDDSGACPLPGTIQTITTSGLASGDFGGMRTGAPIRAFEPFTYGAMQSGGEWYLGRRSGTDPWVPLVGPVDGSGGVGFEYFDAAGNATTTPGAVRRIRVTIRTRSDARDAAGNQIVDALSADVFVRN